MAYRLFADNTCDLPLEYTREHGITVLPVPVTVNGKNYIVGNDPSQEGYLDPDEFYAMLGKGADATTAQINPSDMMEQLRVALDNGEDVLYVTFASSLSGIYNNACLAAQQLQEEYPDRKILAVDSKCESLGYGMLMTLVVKKRDEGATIEEAAEYARNTVQKMQHWFTVGDLKYLKKGGRISATAAVLGSMLAIKPVLNTDTEGRLVLREKVQGRKKAIKALIDHMEQDNANFTDYPVMIGHCDAPDDANFLAEQVEKKFGIKVQLIRSISPIIGAHSGNGTLALFYYADVDRK